MMLFLKILDVLFLGGLAFALRWAWKHQIEVRQRIVQNDGMPRDASRGLIYGLIGILIAGFIMVNVFWLF